jgi:hypothetical protein
MTRHSIWLWLMVSVLGGLDIAKADTGPVVTLDRPAHFTAGDGSAVLIPAGSYQINTAAEARLRLLKEDGPAIEIQATSSSYEGSVSAPLALAIALAWGPFQRRTT